MLHFAQYGYQTIVIEKNGFKMAAKIQDGCQNLIYFLHVNITIFNFKLSASYVIK